jgi:gamma-glutamylcyclotransferase (GGCT)/AIG2-like uncharacterized protein YtfP
MENLFAYGTLMCEDIMREVSGCRLSHLPGILKGYSRHSVKGEHYPALLPDENGVVDGVVYRNVPRPAWDRLNRFEGELYVCSRVHIELHDGSAMLASTYVVQTQYLDQLEQSGWSFADFLRNGKSDFLRYYHGYNLL